MTEYGAYGAWSPEASGDMESMIEPMYEDDIETMINEVRPEDVQHFDNNKFVRITDEQMPEILKFIDESDQFQFDDWAIIGETKGEDEESIPGSSERPPADPAHRKDNGATSTKTASQPKPNQTPAEEGEALYCLCRQPNSSGFMLACDECSEWFHGECVGLSESDAQTLKTYVCPTCTRSRDASLEEEEEEEEANAEDAEEEDQEAEPNENENSMVFSMFLSNWEDQVRQIREAKRLEWEKRMKELLGNEEEEKQKQQKPHEKEFVDDDGDSWVLLDNDDAPAKLAPKMGALDLAANETSTDLQVATVDATQTSTQVARRPGFFESWPSFEVGSKLGVVLAATGTSFAFGFMMGARAAMNSFYRLCERPLVAGVVGVTTAFAVSIQPTMLMTAVKYIILGGVVGGTAVATPVFVVGTTGVFVSAAVYHAWIAAKRSVVRAVGSSSSPVKSPSVNRAIAVPLKMIAQQSRPALLLDAGAQAAKKNA